MSYSLALFSLLCSFPSTSLLVNSQQDLPTTATESNPLRIFIMSGQSECEGQATVDKLKSEASDIYPDLIDPQDDDVWFARLENDHTTYVFGQLDFGSNFGPEISMGRRLADAAAAVSDEPPPILLIKYCIGGSDADENANPGSINNCWDRFADSGTSNWLLQQSDGAVNINSDKEDQKEHMYANLVHTIRKTTEILDDASIPYRYEGFFWIQGGADKDHTWLEYGKNLKMIYEALRFDLGVPDLPVVDSGSGPYNNIRSGKEWAANELFNVTVMEWAGQTLKPNRVNAIPGNVYINVDFYNHYGWDKQATEDSPELVPDGANDKEFAWYKDYPDNTHGEYDAVILRGRALANAYVREFGSDWMSLDSLVATIERDDDPAELFPWDACDEGESPSETNICWINSIDESEIGPGDRWDNILDIISCTGVRRPNADGYGEFGKIC